MKKLIKTLLLGLTLVASVNSWALFDNTGNVVWRADRYGDFKISLTQLSGKTIYANVLGLADADYSSGFDGLCGDKNAKYQGIRLFDVLPDTAYKDCVDYLSGKELIIFTPVGKAWHENYYQLIADKGLYKKGAIIKIQMGNVETREPPKVLQVIKKNKDEWDDSCNANGEYNGVTCEGWSYKSLMPLWGTAYL